jgi:hypothetical protein
MTGLSERMREMTTYKCTDSNSNEEIEIEADTAREAAQDYVDGGSWGEVESTIWVNVYVREVIECDHARVTDGTCEECDETCSQDDEDEDACSDTECPIHGEVEILGDRERIKVAVDPDEPKCGEGGEHDWQSPYDLVGGCKSNPGVWGHGGGVVINEACVRCGCKRVTDTWAQDGETGEQGLRGVSYERGYYAIERAW